MQAMPNAEDLYVEAYNYINEVFDEWDTDGNGYLDRDELVPLLGLFAQKNCALTAEMSEKDIANNSLMLPVLLDMNADGRVTRDEFVLAMLVFIIPMERTRRTAAEELQLRLKEQDSKAAATGWRK